jgi:hypothetical protein
VKKYGGKYYLPQTPAFFEGYSSYKTTKNFFVDIPYTNEIDKEAFVYGQMEAMRARHIALDRVHSRRYHEALNQKEKATREKRKLRKLKKKSARIIKFDGALAQKLRARKRRCQTGASIV